MKTLLMPDCLRTQVNLRETQKPLNRDFSNNYILSEPNVNPLCSFATGRVALGCKKPQTSDPLRRAAHLAYFWLICNGAVRMRWSGRHGSTFRRSYLDAFANIRRDLKDFHRRTNLLAGMLAQGNDEGY